MNKKLEEVFTCNKSTHGETGHCWNGKYSHNQKCGCCDEDVASLLHKAFAAGQELSARKPSVSADELFIEHIYSHNKEKAKNTPMDEWVICKICGMNVKRIYFHQSMLFQDRLKLAEQKGRQEVFDYLKENLVYHETKPKYWRKIRFMQIERIKEKFGVK